MGTKFQLFDEKLQFVLIISTNRDIIC